MTIYLVIGAIGLLLLLGSFIFDGILDGVLEGGPEWLTGISMGAFLTVAGVTGVFLTNMGLAAPLTAVLSIIAAVIVAFLVQWIARATMGSSKQQGAINESNLVGLEGTSILGSAADAAGEVMLNVNGHPHKVNGRCAEALKPGDRVRVISAASITSVIVEKVS